jgi:hypothetical protein
VRYINRFTSETKLLVDARLGDDVRAWARDRLGPDPHGKGPFRDQYGVTSLYLDTEARDVYHRRQSYGRSKFRIRQLQAADVTFLGELHASSSHQRRGSLRHRGRLALDPIPTRRLLVLSSGDPAGCSGRHSVYGANGETPEGPVGWHSIRPMVAGSGHVTLTPHLPLVNGMMILDSNTRAYFRAFFRIWLPVPSAPAGVECASPCGPRSGWRPAIDTGRHAA